MDTLFIATDYFMDTRSTSEVLDSIYTFTYIFNSSFDLKIKELNVLLASSL